MSDADEEVLVHRSSSARSSCAVLLPPVQEDRERPRRGRPAEAAGRRCSDRCSTRPRCRASRARWRCCCRPACRSCRPSTSCADTVNNKVISKAVTDVQSSVREGESIAKPLAKHAVFPPMVVQMIAVGEETGQVDTMLDEGRAVLRPGGRGVGRRPDVADRAAPDRGDRRVRRRGRHRPVHADVQHHQADQVGRSAAVWHRGARRRSAPGSFALRRDRPVRSAYPVLGRSDRRIATSALRRLQVAGVRPTTSRNAHRRGVHDTRKGVDSRCSSAS